MFTSIITAAITSITTIAPETLTDAQVALVEQLMFQCQFALQDREVVVAQHVTEVDEDEAIVAAADSADAEIKHLV